MPVWVKNINKSVEKMIKEKQGLEISLAWDLLETFNNESLGLIGMYRRAAEYALAEMITAAEAKNSKEPEVKKMGDLAYKAVKGAIDDEKKAMKILTRFMPGETPPERKADNTFSTNPRASVNADVKEPVDLTSLFFDIGSFDAQDCSDVVRLYGAFVEKAGPAGVKLVLDQLDGGRAEVVYAELEKARTSGQKGAGDPADIWAVWNKPGKDGKIPINPKTKKEWKFGRHREGKGETQYDAVMTKEKRAQILTVQEFLISFGGGQKIWALKDSSTIKRIDTWFGLVFASDISGTTTDTIAFIQRFFGQTFIANFDKIFYMLPLATIVAGAHHSLLEVALPLSQNGLMDYNIGQYSSLFIPSTGNNSAAGELKSVLSSYEKNKMNHLMLVGYSGDFKDPKNPKDIKVEGAYVFDAKESADFFKMANAKKILATMQKEHAYPTQATVRGFLQRNGFPKVE